MRYILLSLLAVVFSFVLHEFTHWTTGELLGYDMRMTLNKVYPVNGFYREDWHFTFISATGPAITLLQSLCVFLLIKKTHNRNLYPFLFASFYLELLSGIMNFSKANDLGRISTTFNLGLFTIPVIVIALHFLLLYKTIRRENYSPKFTGWTLLLILLFSSFWILLNNQSPIILI